MESQPQNPEFRINPENIHPCINFYKMLKYRVKFRVLDLVKH